MTKTPNTPPKILGADSWVIAEGLAGLQAQGLGLAEAAGLTPQILEIKPRWPWSLMPATAWPEPLGAVGITKPPEGLLITVGGKAAVVGAHLKTRGRTVVQVQNPRMALNKFDLVVANRHDEISGANVIITRTALHRATTARMAEAKLAWADRLSHLPRPLVAVLVGGSNGRFRMEHAEGVAFARQLSQTLVRQRVGMMVTPSRRTSPDVRAVLEHSLRPLGAYVWNMQGDNPYFGMLAHADLIIVTMDSVSMVSEAVATSAPVLIADQPGKSRRIGLFIEGLIKDDRVRRYVGGVDFWPVQPMDDTPWAGEEVRRRLGLDGGG